MGRIAVVNWVSIDGVIQSPLSPGEDRDGGFEHGGWVPPYGDDTLNAFMQAATVDAAGMLVGRRTYEILSDAWSDADESEPAIAAMHRMPKYVVSSRSHDHAGSVTHRLAERATAGSACGEDVHEGLPY